MAPKVYIALFAFLAVQGWTSARVIAEELSTIEVVPLVDISNEVVDEQSIVAPHGNPLDCLKDIEEAYEVAKEVRNIITEGSTWAQNLSAEFKKCVNLDGFEENVKCLYELGKAQYPKGKDLYDRVKAVKDKAKEIMEKFDKCLG